MSSRIIALATATVAIVLTVIGCGGGEPQYDPATQYSPASLAKELAFLYKSLDKDKTGPAEEKSEGATTKGADATKKAPPSTLEALLKDVVRKAASIPGLSQAQACKKVVEEVEKDPTFSDADRKIIAAKLGQVTD